MKSITSIPVYEVENCGTCPFNFDERFVCILCGRGTWPLDAVPVWCPLKDCGAFIKVKE